MTKRKNKGKGLRSKNARKTNQAKATRNSRAREGAQTLAVLNVQQMMVFRPVAEFTPDEGQLLLVRLRDNTYRFGMVLKGKFANYEYHAEEFVTFAHPDRITHCMVVIPPVDFSTAEAEAETPKAEPPEAAAPSIVEAAMAAGAGIDHSEDIYT